MTQDTRTTRMNQLQRNIIARPIDGESVLTVIGAEPGLRGPWPFVTGIPNLTNDVGGPPAQYLSVAGWAA